MYDLEKISLNIFKILLYLSSEDSRSMIVRSLHMDAPVQVAHPLCKEHPY